MSTHEASIILNLTTAQVRALYHKGEIAGYKDNDGRILLHRASVEKYVNTH